MTAGDKTKKPPPKKAAEKKPAERKPNRTAETLDSMREDVRRMALGVFGILACVIALGVAGFLILDDRADDIAAATTQIQESRLDNAAGTCRKDNAIRRAAANAARQKAIDFVKLQEEATGMKTPPHLQPFAERFYDEQEQVTLDAYPHRDCSTPEAIAEFNENQPPDPEPCEPAPGGLCAPVTTTTSTTTTTTPAT